MVSEARWENPDLRGCVSLVKTGDIYVVRINRLGLWVNVCTVHEQFVSSTDVPISKYVYMSHVFMGIPNHTLKCT